MNRLSVARHRAIFDVSPPKSLMQSGFRISFPNKMMQNGRCGVPFFQHLSASMASFAPCLRVGIVRTGAELFARGGNLGARLADLRFEATPTSCNFLAEICRKFI